MIARMSDATAMAETYRGVTDLAFTDLLLGADVGVSVGTPRGQPLSAMVDRCPLALVGRLTRLEMASRPTA
jgi:hypothetical protein